MRLHSHPVATLASMVLLGSLGAVGIAPDAAAATLTVTNCNDTGAGSLRASIAAAASGDTIDLRGLSCTAIRTTSVLTIPQGSLTLQGPGYKRLVVLIDWSDSVLRHTGTGTLRLRGVSISHGTRQVQDSRGGCVYSAGNVDAYDVSIRHCGAHGLGAIPTTGLGGGIYAEGNVTLRYSAVRSSAARGRLSRGGGIYAVGRVTLVRARVTETNARMGGGIWSDSGVSIDTSTIANNLGNEEGGGVEAYGPSTIANSTFSNNLSAGYGAAFWLSGSGSKLIVNSTISGNRGFGWPAGVVIGPSTVANTTIAFNEAGLCNGSFAADDLHLESTIAANSTCNSGAPDWDIMANDSWETITGNDNLVMSSNQPLPADTLSTDPMLGPLADNGGRTLTHALPAGSAALDAGNNTAGLANDQRGPGFPRVKNGRADIGAYER